MLNRCDCAVVGWGQWGLSPQKNPFLSSPNMKKQSITYFGAFYDLKSPEFASKCKKVGFFVVVFVMSLNEINYYIFLFIASILSEEENVAIVVKEQRGKENGDNLFFMFKNSNFFIQSFFFLSLNMRKSFFFLQ